MPRAGDFPFSVCRGVRFADLTLSTLFKYLCEREDVLVRDLAREAGEDTLARLEEVRREMVFIVTNFEHRQNPQRARQLTLLTGGGK